MRILFTGASSFTGYWFVKELVAAGHEVTAALTQQLDSYSGGRRERISQLLPICRVVEGAPFGSDAFLQLIEQAADWDLLCHHGADVTDYKSRDFNYVRALGNNTYQIEKVLSRMRGKGCGRVVLTGTVFEPGEGKGSSGAVSPYGLSKGLTCDVFRYYTAVQGLALAKFVIPNPFGPYEEARFTTSLIKRWGAREVAEVLFPEYVRDNIHVSLLAKAYTQFAAEKSLAQWNPSGYVESQGQFTARFAREMRGRLSLPCEYTLCEQKEFPEPKVRVNTDSLDAEALGWNEGKAWDQLAEYYMRIRDLV